MKKIIGRIFTFPFMMIAYLVLIIDKLMDWAKWEIYEN